MIKHREKRTAQIITALGKKPKTIEQLVKEIYSDVDKGLHKAASGSVYAHLLDLARRGVISAEPDLNMNAEWVVI